MRRRQQAGFSLVEAVVVAALSTLIFGALFSSFQFSLELINNTRAKLSAQSVANDRMEFLRSLPYDDVGTVAGFPAGAIPQSGTTTLNGIEFAERVLIEYVDDPADGYDSATTSDSNGIPLDYKRIKLEYTWNINGATSSVQMISNIVPRSIETTTGGGTARINVLDADSTLLPGASVQLIGSSSTFPINIPRTTDSGGAAIIPVPADSGYSVIVTANISGNQYSTDQTYEATTTNPNPDSAPFAVLEADVSTITFQIGELSDFDLQTLSARTDIEVLEEFDNLDDVATSTNVDTALNALVLEDTLGVYELSGVAYLDPVSPSTLLSWETIRVAADLPTADTDYIIQLFTGSTSTGFTLVPDSELPGNALGFTQSIINISTIDAPSYPELTVGITLTTSDASETPEIDEVALYYVEDETLLGNVNFDMRGDKTIGTDGGGAAIYKFSTSSQTNGTGLSEYDDLEFDNYTITAAGYDIASACSEHPIVHSAGIDTEADLVLVPNDTTTLRVHVRDSLGRAIPGAEVNLQRTGYDVTINTDICGQSFFTGAVSDNSDYILDVSAPGYVTENTDPFVVSGDTVQEVTLVE